MEYLERNKDKYVDHTKHISQVTNMILDVGTMRKVMHLDCKIK